MTILGAIAPPIAADPMLSVPSHAWRDRPSAGHVCPDGGIWVGISVDAAAINRVAGIWWDFQRPNACWMPGTSVNLSSRRVDTPPFGEMSVYISLSGRFHWRALELTKRRPCPTQTMFDSSF